MVTMTRQIALLAILAGVCVGLSRALLSASQRNGKSLTLLRLSTEIVTCALFVTFGSVLGLRYLPNVDALGAIALSGVATHLGLRQFYSALVKQAGLPLGSADLANDQGDTVLFRQLETELEQTTQQLIETQRKYAKLEIEAENLSKRVRTFEIDSGLSPESYRKKGVPNE